MSLEGIRAWIGEVERKLGVRTRVFLALAAIAIGIAGAGIYLSLDTRSDAVSEADVQQLQRELEARMGGVAGGVEPTQASALEAEIEALRSEVEQLRDGGNGGTGTGGGGSGNGGGGSGNGADGGTAPGSPGPDIQDLLEEAQKQGGQ